MEGVKIDRERTELVLGHEDLPLSSSLMYLKASLEEDPSLPHLTPGPCCP